MQASFRLYFCNVYATQLYFGNKFLSQRELQKIERRRKQISPIPQGGRRISRSAFLSRLPFGYYLPIASYGSIFATKWSSNGGLEAEKERFHMVISRELFSCQRICRRRSF